MTDRYSEAIELIKELNKALQQVQFVMTYVNECNIYPKCPWCHGDHLFGHQDDCRRQVALKKTGAFLTEETLVDGSVAR